LTTAGIFSSAESVEGIFNSRGLNKWHTQTLAEVSITMLADDSSGWQKANSPDVTNLDPHFLAEVAAKKAIDSAHPAQIPAGKYTVILEPAAVLDIVGFMFWDDVAHPLQTGCPFDGEGMQRQTVPLVENGVVRRVVYARATAERMKRSEQKDKVGPIVPTG